MRVLAIALGLLCLATVAQAQPWDPRYHRQPDYYGNEPYGDHYYGRYPYAAGPERGYNRNIDQYWSDHLPPDRHNGYPYYGR